MEPILIIYLCVIAFLTFITFFAYYIDKRKAIKGTWRTKEKTLLIMSIFGGAIGGFLGLYLIRHKNKHWYFVLSNIFGLILIMGGLLIILLLS